MGFLSILFGFQNTMEVSFKKNRAKIDYFLFSVSHNERCKLYCRIKDSQAFYLLKEKVLDGTPCDQNGDDICIDGTCHKAGCDHRLGSDMKRDICGICGGDGSTCQTVEGVYNERGSFGYNEVLKIPAGSANIDIKQNAHNKNKDDDNYLGKFILTFTLSHVSF